MRPLRFQLARVKLAGAVLAGSASPSPDIAELMRQQQDMAVAGMAAMLLRNAIGRPAIAQQARAHRI